MVMNRTLDKNDIHSLARLFSPMVIRELGTRGRSAIIGRILRHESLHIIQSGAMNLGEVLDRAFDYIKRPGNRPEYVFTTALVHRRLLGRHNLNTATALREFRVGSSRVDLAIFNGTSTAYEIKSDWDTLARLEGQISDYIKVFEHVNIFTSEAYVERVLDEFPPEIGVLTLSKRFNISTHRQSTSNLMGLDPELIFRSLRTQEAQQVLQAYGHQIPEMPNTLVRAYLRNIFVQLTPEEAARGMHQVIKITRGLQRSADTVLALPPSVRPAVITATLSVAERERILQAMNTPIDSAIAWR